LGNGAEIDLIAAVFLGVVQGLTEFLPISSSAHLILVPWLFGWNPEGLAFDVALHVGTAVAILAYFWRDWVKMAHEAIRGLLQGRPLHNEQARVAWLIAAGSIPAAAAGLGLESAIETYFRSPLVTVWTLILFALLLHYAERRSRQTRSLAGLNMVDALWIGGSQAIALVPGVSRSGITISAAMLRNMDRSSAAQFSFLLSTPVVVGAGMLEALKLWTNAAENASGAAAASGRWDVILIGSLTASVTGFLCIKYFLRYVRTRGFMPFVIYRIIVALCISIYYIKYYI